MKRVKFRRHLPWVLIGDRERLYNGEDEAATQVETWAMDTSDGRGVLVARDIIGPSCSTSLIFIRGMHARDLADIGWENVCEEGDPDCGEVCPVHGHEEG